MKLQKFLCPAPGFLAHKRRKGDAVFESFALVNRNDPHRVFVAFQTQFMFIPNLAPCPILPRQPLNQPINAEPALNTNRVQQFDQMQDVGESTFAVTPEEQTRPHFFRNEKRPHHLHEALVAPQQVVIGKAIERRFPL